MTRMTTTVTNKTRMPSSQQYSLSVEVANTKGTIISRLKSLLRAHHVARRPLKLACRCRQGPRAVSRFPPTIHVATAAGQSGPEGENHAPNPDSQPDPDPSLTLTLPEPDPDPDPVAIAAKAEKSKEQGNACSSASDMAMQSTYTQNNRSISILLPLSVPNTRYPTQIWSPPNQLTTRTMQQPTSPSSASAPPTPTANMPSPSHRNPRAAPLHHPKRSCALRAGADGGGALDAAWHACSDGAHERAGDADAGARFGVRGACVELGHGEEEG